MSKLKHTIDQCGRIATQYGLDFNPNADTPHFWRVMKKNKQSGAMYAVALAISKEAVRILERGIEGKDDCPPIVFSGSIEHFDGSVCLVKGTAESSALESDATFTDVGEANPKNCTIAFPAAMAWKRCKQRCVLGILGLDGVYSEEESEDFKRTDEGFAVTQGPPSQYSAPSQGRRQAPYGPPPQQRQDHQAYPQPQQQQAQPPQQQPAQGGGHQGGQQYPPAKEPRAYVDDIERGEEPPLNPWSMTFNKGKFQGWTWVEAFKAAHQEQMQKGGPIEDNYIRWYCREFGPSAITRKFSKPPTDFQIKMWATLLWMLRWVDPVSGQKKAPEQQGDPQWTQPPANQAPPPAGPQHNWEEGRNEPSMMDQPQQGDYPQGPAHNFGVPVDDDLNLPDPKTMQYPGQQGSAPIDDTPF